MGQRYNKDSLRASWAAVIVELAGRRIEHYPSWNAWFIEGHTPGNDKPNKRINKATVEGMLRAGVLVEEPEEFDRQRLLRVAPESKASNGLDSPTPERDLLADGAPRGVHLDLGPHRGAEGSTHRGRHLGATQGVTVMKPTDPVSEGSFSAYECWKCKQYFCTNPEDPPPPHLKPDSSEWCVDEAEWHARVEECP